MSSPSIFDSYNARTLAPYEVAESFVENQHFKHLIKRNHSIIVGPRGSGKTTLLKMLQPSALANWKHPEAEEYRSKLNYTSIFIPTDRSWNAQVAAFAANKVSTDDKVIIALSVFTTHVLKAVVQVIEYRCSSKRGDEAEVRKCTLSMEKEAEIVNALRKPWHIDPSTNTFSSLKFALSARLSLLKEITIDVARNPHLATEKLSNVPFLNMHFVDSSSLLVEAFDDAINDQDGRWAFCFDELELAPEWVTKELIESIRSINEKFIFKLALSPYTGGGASIQDAFSALPKQDYSEIQLWYAHKEEGYVFCRELLKGILNAKNLNSNVNPKQIFGEVRWETDPRDWIKGGSAYRSGSTHQRLLKSLAAKDPDFKLYLKRKNVDLDRLEDLDGDERAEVLRKIISLVAVRDEFRTVSKDPKQALRERSRKNPQLYTGATAIFAISEGNPRWFIGMVSNMITNSREKGIWVLRSKQAKEISETTDRFRYLIRTVPMGNLSSYNQGLLDFIDKIGFAMHKKAVEDKFEQDFIGSFTVDPDINQDIEHYVEQALNVGAIVLVSDKNSPSSLSSVKGKRYRLSYLLAPYYKIPITLGRSWSLLKIMDLSTRHGYTLFRDEGEDE